MSIDNYKIKNMCFRDGEFPWKMTFQYIYFYFEMCENTADGL